MKLLVERLADTPRTLHLEGTDAWWQALSEALPEIAGSDTPLVIELSGHRMGEDLYLAGSVAGEVELLCGRCLNRYRHPLREPFRLVLEPARGRVPAEPDAAAALARDGVCLGDELEAGWFQGSEIDLGAFFQEVVTLVLPFQPRCREDCRGLCPACGIDRNAESCECEPRVAKSPFAVLERLRAGQREGEH